MVSSNGWSHLHACRSDIVSRELLHVVKHLGTIYWKPNEDPQTGWLVIFKSRKYVTFGCWRCKSVDHMNYDEMRAEGAGAMRAWLIAHGLV